MFQSNQVLSVVSVSISVRQMWKNYLQWCRCILGNVGTRFCKRRRMCGIKNRVIPPVLLSVERSAMLDRWTAFLKKTTGAYITHNPTASLEVIHQITRSFLWTWKRTLTCDVGGVALWASTLCRYLNKSSDIASDVTAVMNNCLSTNKMIVLFYWRPCWILPLTLLLHIIY